MVCVCLREGGGRFKPINKKCRENIMVFCISTLQVSDQIIVSPQYINGCSRKYLYSPTEPRDWNFLRVGYVRTQR